MKKISLKILCVGRSHKTHNYARSSWLCIISFIFAAPELVLDRPVDCRTDIWALGVMVFTWQVEFLSLCNTLCDDLIFTIHYETEYDTENHSEKSNHTETRLKPHWKSLQTHCIFFFYHTEICFLFLFKNVKPFVIPLKLTEKSMLFNPLSQFSALLCFQCDFQCHILIVI